MHRRLAVAPLLFALLLSASPAFAGMLSKVFEFKADTTLTVGAATESGLRLDAVRFRLPVAQDGRYSRTSGLASTEVSLSNTTASSLKAGVAIALFDAEGRLVAVASGGSRWAPIKPNRQKTFRLVFDNVNHEIFDTGTFQITIETKD